jgi:hypothetical protein
LLSAGLITPEQLDESLAAAHTAGKPLGHVLVEQGIVPAHSLAMALADQHGGPLKTEFGFATGRGSTPRSPSVLSEAPTAPPVLRLAPTEPVAEVAPPTVTVTPAPEPTPEPEPPTAAAVSPERDAEEAVRLHAEARVNELLARIDELQAELEAAGPRAAEEAAAPLRAQIEALRARLDAQATSEETLTPMREELATAQAAAAALRTQFAAEREAREQDAKTVEAWRAQLEDARTRTEQAAKTEEELRAQLEELRGRDDVPPALAAAEEQIAAVRGELETAVAAAEALRLQLAAERSTTERAATSADALTVQIEELRSQRAADSGAVAAAEASLAAARAELAAALADADTLRKTTADDRAERERAVETAETLRAELDDLRADRSAEETLAALRAELAQARSDAETMRATLAAEREAHQEVVVALGALRARVVELEAAALEAAAREAAALEAAALEAAAREAQPPAVAPLHEDVDQLRAVIELQEQALTAAAARERARDGDARVVVDPSSTRTYSSDLHFLFAPNADGYELLERSGPPPAPGEVVELSGGRRCRVLRVGPAPFPGARERCAYLELV